MLITHPGRQHSHQAALGLERAGLLAGYWAGAPALTRHGRFVPGPLWRRFVRYTPLPLPANKVRWYPMTPLLRRLGDLALPRAWNHSLDFFACRNFDRWAARGLRSLAPRAVIACEISALSTFAAAESQGILRLLDAPSIHHRAQDHLHGFTEPANLHHRITAVKDAEIAHADAILTVSELARATYLEAGVSPEKVHAIPLGADLDLFGSAEEKPPRSGPVRFLFSGAMIRRKGFDLLLAAFNEVRRQCPGVELVLVGPRGNTASELDRYAGTGIRELGTVTQQELACELQSADCLVLPSRNDSYGMVVAEALAAGRPVMVSEMVGSKDLVKEGETGWIVPLEDLETLTRRMLDCAHSPELVRLMAPACVRAAQGATWEAYHRRFAALVATLLAR